MDVDGIKHIVLRNLEYIERIKIYYKNSIFWGLLTEVQAFFVPLIVWKKG